MTLTLYSGLSKDFSSLLSDADDFNVIIQVGENQNTKEFLAHSVILRARSPYFKSAFSTKWIIKKNNMIKFNKPNITPSVFDMILKYIYTGELDLTERSGDDILGLLVASDELLIEELFNHIQDYLIERQSNWVQKNYVLVLNTVFKLANCKKLQNHCLESICDDPRPFITSETFPSIDKDILFSLLRRDNLQIDEAVFWVYLIKWSIEQIPGLGSAKWNNDNYEALKKTLNEFIPLIRFVEISPADLHDKVHPYNDDVPQYIYEEVTRFYYKKALSNITTFPCAGRITSTIIKPNIANIFANWIDRNDSAVLSYLPNNKYRFNLIYLMSRDGFDFTTFYNKCNERGPFILLVRVQSKKIYGGYNPIGYAGRQSQWMSSTESFTFSFENDQGTHNMKISRVINAKHSVYESINYNHFFNFGNHLYIIGNGKLFVGISSHYNKAVSNNVYISLPIEEIEVFSIVKK